VPKAQDLVMTYPRTAVPPPFQRGALPTETWERTWDLVHAQVVAEMKQAEQQILAFTSSMPSMNPLSMFYHMFKSLLCSSKLSRRGGAMAMIGDAQAAATLNQQTWLMIQADAAAAFAPYGVGVVLATEQRYHHGGMHSIGPGHGHSYTVIVGLAFSS